MERGYELLTVSFNRYLMAFKSQKLNQNSCTAIEGSNAHLKLSIFMILVAFVSCSHFLPKINEMDQGQVRYPREIVRN